MKHCLPLSLSQTESVSVCSFVQDGGARSCALDPPPSSSLAGKSASARFSSVRRARDFRRSQLVSAP